MKKQILKLYKKLFGKTYLTGFHKNMLRLAHRGLGGENYYGEQYLIKTIYPRYFYKTCVKKIVVDIGAATGGFTSELFSNLTSGIDFYARMYEPTGLFYKMPQSFDFCDCEYNGDEFQAIHKKYKTTKFVAKKQAVGAVPNENFIIYDYNDGSCCGTSNVSILREYHKKDFLIPHSVKCITLKDIYEEVTKFLDWDGNIHLLKLDVEGGEYDILRGADRSEMFEKINMIQFEFGPMAAYNDIMFKRFYDLLTPHYRLFRCLTNGLQEITKYEPEICEMYATHNYLAFNKMLDIRAITK